MDDVLGEMLKTKPEFLLVVLIMVFSPLMMIPLIIIRLSPRIAKRRLVKELLDNPAVQERMRDPQLNFTELLDQLLKSADGAVSTAPPKIGILAKINQDITWDVSGLIGLIVTMVIMIMIVSRTYDNMPREILAGWTTILGFYFGKAVKEPPSRTP